MDWETRRLALQWTLVGYQQQAKAVWSLRKVNRVGRRPVVLGRPRVDATDMEVGDDFKIWSGYRQTLVTGWGRIRLGDRVFLNCGTALLSVLEITIGDDVALANEVYVMDSNSHGMEGKPHVEAPVVIGDGTWVGARAMILPGVTIGKRVVVAAGSVVTRDVPDDVLVAGNPARIVRPLEYPAGCRRAWHDEAGCACPKLVEAVGGAPDLDPGPVTSAVSAPRTPSPGAPVRAPSPRPRARTARR